MMRLLPFRCVARGELSVRVPFEGVETDGARAILGIVDWLIPTSRGTVSLHLSAGFGEEPAATAVRYDEDGQGDVREQWMSYRGAPAFADWLAEILGISSAEANAIAGKYVAIWKESDDGNDRRGLRRFSAVMIAILAALVGSALALAALLTWLLIT